MSSKKKRRYNEYLKRQEKREHEKFRKKRLREILQNGTMKEIADELGIPLI